MRLCLSGLLVAHFVGAEHALRVKPLPEFRTQLGVHTAALIRLAICLAVPGGQRDDVSGLFGRLQPVVEAIAGLASDDTRYEFTLIQLASVLEILEGDADVAHPNPHDILQNDRPAL